MGTHGFECSVTLGSPSDKIILHSRYRVAQRNDNSLQDFVSRDMKHSAKTSHTKNRQSREGQDHEKVDGSPHPTNIRTRVRAQAEGWADGTKSLARLKTQTRTHAAQYTSLAYNECTMIHTYMRACMHTYIHRYMSRP
jgi:hypothetical protein